MANDGFLAIGSSRVKPTCWTVGSKKIHRIRCMDGRDRYYLCSGADDALCLRTLHGRPMYSWARDRRGGNQPFVDDFCFDSIEELVEHLQRFDVVVFDQEVTEPTRVRVTWTGESVVVDATVLDRT
jgi:hypothetical protein